MNKDPKYSIELARPAGFEPATRCLEGTVRGSREVAWCRPMWRSAEDTIAGNREGDTMAMALNQPQAALAALDEALAECAARLRSAGATHR